jgi:glyoxylase-like metal-dependent hydrolase (beta-lactamase superfamily II)
VRGRAARAAVLGALLLACVPAVAGAQALMGMQRLADGVYVYTDSDGGNEAATVSSLVVVTDDGVLVGDGLGRVGDVAESDAMVRRMLAEIGKLTNQPVRYLINCSWHPDHTNGNHIFRDAGAVIVAHRRARADLLEYYTTAPDVPKAPPTLVFDDSLTLFLGGKEIRIQHLGRAHTAADAVIHLPQQRVAFLSEIFFNKQFPGLRSGYPTEWIQTLDRALALDADIFVPGHGLVEDGGRLRPTVVQMRDDLIAMHREIKGYHDQGLTRAQIMERKPLQKYASLINASRNLPIAVDRILAELGAGAGGLR